jgi:hypothetical protein
MGLLPPPVLYACPGPYAIFSAYTGFILRGDPGGRHPPGWDPSQKFSYKKFFRDLDDGGHSDEVGKPLKGSSNGNWGRS